ncbi:MAG: class I SAM-dependent methyltransferase [candidate division WOR-3 bacterium]|nr:MAG: class I SAM-dependent methyltransferase [candidate division WOR-3 bacterium]
MNHDWDKIYRDMSSYYEARAQEYDEFYIGKSPAIPRPESYTRDVEKIGEMVKSFGRGHVIDIACGTGFWLRYYARNCSRITLFDYSEKMLAVCKKRVDDLCLEDKCSFVRGDFFEYTFGERSFDSTLVGFFICHLSPQQEERFFLKVNKFLRPHGQFMIIDSCWSHERAHYRNKEGIQERTLNDGRTFTIYKRYFDESDIKEIFNKYALKLEALYMGNVFFGAVGLKS